MRRAPVLALILLLAAGAAAAADETFDDALQHTSAEYEARRRAAAEELNRVRARIAGEQAPLLAEVRAQEDRILAAQAEITRLETGQENAASDRRHQLLDREAARKASAYLQTLARDGLKLYGEGLLPGEAALAGDRVRDLTARLDTPDRAGAAALDAADFLADRVELALGGYAAPGAVVTAGDREQVQGTLAFAGPAAFFRPASGGLPGLVLATGSDGYPVSHGMAGWPADEAAAWFAGRPGSMMADVSGGKLLQLEAGRGDLRQHIAKGGPVAYAIVAVGLVALLLIAQKGRDVLVMGVSGPDPVREFLQAVARADGAEAERRLAGLGRSTRELLAEGWEHRQRPKAVLEERLQAVLLRQRLHFERRLPLLAVIATASPLMGLLGTVVGMVRTFALITVFGTGNAGKLAGGISEVLVATELGLVVAIPTLVAHGFLAHRIQKNLALLERYALEFVTAATGERAELDADAAEEEGVPA